MNTPKRNVLILAVCQGLSVCGLVITTTAFALCGQVLAEDEALATIPLGISLTANMLMAIPASFLMAKIGRKIGFSCGQIIGMIGGVVALYALIYEQSFVLLCISGVFLGAHNAFWQFYRFAAVDTAPIAYRSRAISYVLAGGVVAALLGPEIAVLTADLFKPIMFAGVFVSFTVLCIINFLVLQLLQIPKNPESWKLLGGRPLIEIIKKPTFIIAAAAGMVGYGLMVLVMTATPLAMIACGYTFGDSAFIIQWHAFAMFAPGFITGHLIKKFGVNKIILSGCVLYLLSMIINLAGLDVHHFWFGLVLVGIGWNFMFVGGSTLLTDVYTPEEKAKVQAFNDFLIFASAAGASFASGALQNLIGWDAVNFAVAAPVIAIMLLIYLLKQQNSILST